MNDASGGRRRIALVRTTLRVGDGFTSRVGVAQVCALSGRLHTVHRADFVQVLSCSRPGCSLVLCLFIHGFHGDFTVSC